MNRVMLVVAIGASLAAMAACTTTRNPNYCASDTDCEAATPFCDVAGEFDESNHETHTCTVRPAGCLVDRCGCENGSTVSCTADTAQVCNPDGHSSSPVDCSLGCADATRCVELQPSNGLGAALAQAATEPDVRFPVGTVIDTDLGTATVGTTSVAVRSIVVAQPDGSTIRAFLARSLIIEGATVRGQNPLALVAATEIFVRGGLVAKAARLVDGPGARDGTEACAGEGDQQNNNYGSGGGGNATVGGAGGGLTAKRGGSMVTTFEPLRGGCRGGSMSGQVPPAIGGGGGGAVQLVSGGDVTLSNTGLIDVGGGGGDDHAGGGSGGSVIIEGANVYVTGGAAGLAANGGSGGGCTARGTDGGSGTSPAFAPKCSVSTLDPGSGSAGNGGTGTVPPQSAEQWACDPFLICQLYGGGGGGAAGRFRIATKDGTVDLAGSPVISGALSTGTISLH